MHAAMHIGVTGLLPSRRVHMYMLGAKSGLQTIHSEDGFAFMLETPDQLDRVACQRYSLSILVPF